MNIIVKTQSGHYIVRPDTTWERDNEDLFVPDFVSGMSYVPALFVRISKPGRSVGERFASRYYDGVGFGVLLYPDNLNDGSPEGFACASCLDHTSFLSFPVLDRKELSGDGKLLELSIGSEKVFSSVIPQESVIGQAIAEATRFIYIRTGDLLAIELSEMKSLGSGDCGEKEMTASWGGTKTCGFKVIF